MKELDDFLKRLPASSPHRLTVELAGRAADGFRQKAADIRGDKRYSAEGHREQVKAAAEIGPVQFFSQIKKQAAGDRHALNSRKSEFELKPPNRADLVGAVERQEIRTFLRSLKPHEAMRLALEDPSIAQAALHAPRQLSGLPEDIFDRIRDAELERQFGPELKILGQESEELDLLDAAISIAESRVRVEAEMKSTPEDQAA
jgi:hypothetical protein